MIAERAPATRGSSPFCQRRVRPKHDRLVEHTALRALFCGTPQVGFVEGLRGALATTRCQQSLFPSLRGCGRRTVRSLHHGRHLPDPFTRRPDRDARGRTAGVPNGHHADHVQGSNWAYRPSKQINAYPALRRLRKAAQWLHALAQPSLTGVQSDSCTRGAGMGTSPNVGVGPAAMYIDGVQAVLAAGGRLEAALAGDPPARREAERRLEAALLRADTGREALGPLMFADKAALTERPASEDALGSILVEIEVANVSLAASRVAEQTSVGEAAYATALQDLRGTTRGLELAASSRDPRIAADGHLGFRLRREIVVDRPASLSVAAARRTLDTTVDQTVATIVDESRNVAHAFWAQAIKMPGLRQLDQAIALAQDTQLQEAGGVSGTAARLFVLGVHKLKAALAALQRLLGLSGVGDVRHHLAPIWSDLETTDPLRQALLRIYGASETFAAKRRALTYSASGRLDAASASLMLLAERFRETARVAAKLLRALALASGLVGAIAVVLPAASVNHLALTAAGYLLVLTGVLLTGMDYMDSGTVLGRVDGMRRVLGGLAT